MEEFTEETPLSILMDKEQTDINLTYTEAYREASIKQLTVMKQTMEFILEAPDINLACLAVGYVLNTSLIAQSMRKRAESLGYSHNSISRYAVEYKKLLAHLSD